MKKNIILLPLFAACFALADDEVYDGQNINNMDFSNAKLNYSSWRNTGIGKSNNFTGTSLKEADFTGATISVEKFANANLKDSIFDKSICYGAKFDGANLTNASFLSATLIYSHSQSSYNFATSFVDANLTNAKLSGLTFSTTYNSVNFKNANLRNADLSDGIFTTGEIYSRSYLFDGADLTGTNFTNATFADISIEENSNRYYNRSSAVSLQNTIINKTNFTGAILCAGASSVDFSNMSLIEANFTNAILSAKSWSGTSSCSVSFSNAKLINCIFTGAILGATGGADTGVDFSGMDMANVSFAGATFNSHVKLKDCNIQCADFSAAVNLTTSHLSATKSYADKNLYGVKFGNLDLSNWILRGQNLQNTSFAGANLTGVNARYADLRGSDLTGITGSLKTQNTIWTDGEIKNFSMESVDDSLTIRAYVPATSGGEMINAKISEDATISGGAVLTLEEGAILEIMAGKTLTVADNSEIIFNVDVASNNTKILLNSGSTIAFGEDSKVTINLDGVISPDDSYTFSAIEAATDACISGADAISKDNLVLNVNGEAYDSDKWGFNFDPTTGALTINVNVPEPATVTAIFGAVALAFAVYRRRR